jgi:hypothetical protein
MVWLTRVFEGVKVLAAVNAIAMTAVLVVLAAYYVGHHSWGELAFALLVSVLTYASSYGLIIGSNFALRRIRIRHISN